MLKCLELVGFKSFADKTRFDFDPGVTCIVGPNGSGKSNVVDAVRWVLGEQSAKSLRGKEMADVIFNGSKNRRPLGMAEASLFIDNRNRPLAIDVDDVVVTRRVYRSGEGEYLINGQVSRLKDVREMFMGSGGSGAYNIIAQGQVETLLQASSKDRRLIFEEASGISKFKAKKIEALRRLERIEQDEARAHDITVELEKQTQSLRLQAGKAQKYKESADRLRELRLSLGLADYTYLTGRIHEVESAVADERRQVEQYTHELATAESRLRMIDETLAEREQTIREASKRLGDVRERLSRLEAEVEGDAKRLTELDQEWLQAAGRGSEARHQFADASRRVDRLQRQLAADNSDHQQAKLQIQALLSELTELSDTLTRLRAAEDEDQALAADRLQQLSRLENEQTGLESQLAVLWQQQTLLSEKHGRLAAAAEQHRAMQAGLAERRQTLSQQAQQIRDQIADTGRQLDDIAARRDQLLLRRSDIREEQAAYRSRLNVLESFVERLEGLSGGVREVLRRRAEKDPVWQPVLGMLADYLRVPADLAELAELALGRHTQALLLRSVNDLSSGLLSAARRLPGRVDFLTLEPPPGIASNMTLDADLAALSFARQVQCDDRLRPLVNRLLGNCFLVDSFAATERLRRQSSNVRLITKTGEILHPDGTISIGPTDGSVGLITRATELRALQSQQQERDRLADTLDRELGQLDDQMAAVSDRLQRLQTALDEFDKQKQAADLEFGEQRERGASLTQQAETTHREIDEIETLIKALDLQFQESESRLADLHQTIRQAHEKKAEASARLAELTERRDRVSAALRERQTALAVQAERLGTLEAQVAAAVADVAQREQVYAEVQGQLDQISRRRTETERRLLAGRAGLASLYSEVQRLDPTPHAAGHDFASHRQERARLAEQVEEYRQGKEQIGETLHKADVKLTEWRMKLDQLLARTREDYDLDLAAAVPADYERPAEAELAEAREEAEEHRRRLAKLGAVNLQAIEELEAADNRARAIRTQLDDLTEARRQLAEVIEQINEESRRLFLETFETVRVHFQDLFRKVFGGGQADMILEDEADVLECGIEIIAHPPGKEPRSISLLSGGEKTMTAVALVMALFRSKPSPFCVLDEVDAALDESNIGRFISVLREFLDKSQFMLITHSKTTMQAADVMHGVTQREAGVSIRVSIRLDQVSEDGHIRDDDAPAAAA